MTTFKTIIILLITSSIAAASIDDIISQIRTLEQDIRDMAHVGPDGVARAFDSNGIVLNYIRFSNDELAELESDRPQSKKVWTSVDGNDVEHADCQNPPDQILPLMYRLMKVSARVRRGTDSGLLKRLKFCDGAYCDYFNIFAQPGKLNVCSCYSPGGGSYTTCNK